MIDQKYKNILEISIEFSEINFYFNLFYNKMFQFFKKFLKIIRLFLLNFPKLISISMNFDQKF